MITKGVLIGFGLALAVAGTARSQQPVNAASLFSRNCASCHGAKGSPSAAMAHSMGVPDFSKPATLAAISDSVLRATVANGKGRMMAAFKGRLKPAEIDSLVAYIRTFGRP